MAANKGSGLRTQFFNNFVRPKCLVRQGVTAADNPSPLQVADGEIDNRTSQRGDNNTIYLYIVLMGQITTARVQLWIDAESLGESPVFGVDATEYCKEESSSSESAGSQSSESSESASACIETRNWCLVDWWDLENCTSELLWFRHLPPGRYKVTIPVLDGVGSIDIHEQHTE